MSERSIGYGERGRVVVVPDAQALAERAAEALRDAAVEAVAERGYAYVALSGGSTPKLMGNILGADPMKNEVPWGSLQVFWGDERWAPIESAESNAGEAKRGYLDTVPIPPAHVHPFDTDGDPDASAREYAELIHDLVPGEPTPTFDLILLGMGDDGHTASLFPHTPALSVTDRLVVANPVPKLDTVRLTFTAPLINAARRVVFLVAGAGKAERLSEVLDGLGEPDRLPSQLVRPVNGELIWLADEAAVSKLERAAK
jgi:6-phosphogluconolactonase